jgi:hypothetical protein
MPYTDGYTVPSDAYGTRTVTTLSLGLTVRCTVRIYAVLTVKRRPSRPCIRLNGANEYTVPNIEMLTNLVEFPNETLNNLVQPDVDNSKLVGK